MTHLLIISSSCLFQTLSAAQRLKVDPFKKSFSPTCYDQLRLKSQMEMKSKLKVLVILTLLYGAVKVVQFSLYIVSVLRVIQNDDCEHPCVIEYAELSFLVCMFFTLVLLVYGIVKVKHCRKYV